MNATISAAQAETECRAFAAEFPTPNTLRAISLAESGRLAWVDIHRVLLGALAKGLAEVK
jgi:hypothetical protein